MTDRSVWLVELGRVSYGEGQEIQQRLVSWRQRGWIGDTLLLLEHDPVITLGRRADEGHILAPSATLAREGVVVCRTERGGDVTYHGPGQLIAYPIMHLPSLRMGASDYMHRLGDVVARALEPYGIITHRRDHIIGVWVGENKIAALGVRIKRGVTFHGLALNVAPNMRHWSYIIPCGITDGGVTSILQEVGYAPAMGRVRQDVTSAFGEIFGATLVPASMDDLAGVASQANQARADTSQIEST